MHYTAVTGFVHLVGSAPPLASGAPGRI